MNPIDYSIDVKSPFDQAIAGYGAGAAIRNDQQQQAQLQAQQKQQAAMQQDLVELSKNPTTQGIVQRMIKYPQLSEQLKRPYDSLNADQQQAHLSEASQLYAAISSGNDDVVSNVLQTRIDAAKNSGDAQRGAASDALLQLYKIDKNAAKTAIGMHLASIVGPDKFSDTYGKLGSEQRAAEVQPAVVKKANAEANSAEVKSKYAESNELVELKKKNWDITKIQADIDVAKQNSRIAAMNAQSNRMDSETKRQELGLKIQEAVQKRDETIRAKVADATTSFNQIDTLLNTISRIRNTPDVVKRAAHGSFDSNTPTIQDDVRDYEELLKSMGDQVLAANLPAWKASAGGGNFSDGDRDAVKNMTGSFNLKQSVPMNEKNIDILERILAKTRKGISMKTGMPEPVPDTPDATASPQMIDDLVKKYTNPVKK